MRKPFALALATAALLATAAPASAADYTITGGKLDWTIANYFASGDPDRTWLGYVTNTTGGGAANGNATVIAPATLVNTAGVPPTAGIIDGTTPRGLDRLFTFSYPAKPAGQLSSAGVGTIELEGTVRFVIHAAMGLQPITLVDPHRHAQRAHRHADHRRAGHERRAVRPQGAVRPRPVRGDDRRSRRRHGQDHPRHRPHPHGGHHPGRLPRPRRAASARWR